MKVDDLLSKLPIVMLELSIKASPNPLIEAHAQCTKLLSKVCVKQCLEALVYVYVYDEACTYQIGSCYSCALMCHFDCV